MQNANCKLEETSVSSSFARDRSRFILQFAICILHFAILMTAQPARAQKDAPRALDPDPEMERKTFKVAEGFEVSLYAADPLLAKPIAMNFDSAGRLWLACSEAYPQIKPGQA